MSTPFSPAGSRTQQVQTVEAARGFVADVFGWMFLGLAVTAGVAALFAGSHDMTQWAEDHGTAVLIILIAQVALVFGLIFALNRISAAVARLLFLLYAASLGFTFSFILQAYTTSSIVSTFVVTAGMFGAAAAYGWITKRDLTMVGQIAFFGIVGLILTMIVNIFLRSSTVEYVISIVGVILFTGLTAYDTQKVKQTAALATGDGEAERKAAIFGALALYLDFINMFLFLLRIFGGSR